MLPPSKSEYEQNHAEEHALEAQMHADQVSHPEDDNAVVEAGDVDADAVLDLDAEGEDLGQDEVVKPTKKPMGKGTLFAIVGATLLVALSGGAYLLQGQVKKPVPVSKKIVIDPSLLESKPAPAGVVTPMPPASLEVTANAPMAVTSATQNPSSLSALTSPPADPFGGATTAPVATATASSTETTVKTTTVVPPAVSVVPAPVVTVVPAPVVIVPPKSVSITPAPTSEGPRADPFGSMAPDKVVKVEKSVVTTVKSVKVSKAKPVAVASEEIEMVKPRVVKKKTTVRKSRVIRRNIVIQQNMTISETHPSQERVQPQSSESFHGYEKLF